jgi:LemA protein
MGMRARSLAFIVLALLALPGCSYDVLQQQDEDAKAAWSEVLNQYQRRSELIPNLVRTVKGYADQPLRGIFELRGVTAVTEALAKEADSVQLTPELVNEPQAFAKFQETQGQLSTVLDSLFAVASRYPQLQSDANFRDLLEALAGTQQRIVTARNRYIDAVSNYNVTVRAFPTSLTARMFDFQVKPNFTLANELPIPTVAIGRHLLPATKDDAIIFSP